MDGFPIIEVADLDRALAFYRDGLGGVIDYRFPPDGETRYVSLRLGEATLGLGVVPGLAPAPSPVLLWFYVDATTADLAQRGFTVVEEPVDQPWGERVSLVLDPFGIRVRLGTATGPS
ncbi:bleomycin resistance protein [Herbidospora sp. NEAU-GS84]|uniref:Bleomycin resistance protein n=1 Tax=Herbidospora solisilvae TaxID=2696284 RepID=A0A7C9NKX5_9ACTN|nr:glyoxalase superfamily protein [Herbidospora solisilvae]NAS25818.1 bleomycin resistance protein [Herbidospora solisilvae]